MNIYNIFFVISLFHKFKYRWVSTKYYRTGLKILRNLFLWGEKQETL